MRSFLCISAGVALSLGLVMIADAQTTTPIQNVVVIYGENISFDHYFGTYPKAANPPGQPRFVALPGTPVPNNYESNPTLLTNNPNLNNTGNGTGAANPFRFNRDQAYTADMSHSYAPEQEAYDLGFMDLFPKYTGSSGGTTIMNGPVTTKGEVMGYFDGNTVTAMWEYAQNFALNDNNFNTQFGPSSPGAINLVSGQTNGVDQSLTKNTPSSDEIQDGQGGWTEVGDADPYGDICSGSSTFQMNFGPANLNVGNLLNNAGITWGWFQGGFNLQLVNPNGTTGCSRSTVSPITGLTEADYVQHHNPFQFYPSTQNTMHLRPTGTIGTSDQANHMYDIQDWFAALSGGNLPAVSFLKAQAYQNAHPGNSNPLDEQAFVVTVVNAIMASPYWSNTAIIIDYDDSDGWYDHVMAPIGNASFSTDDFVSGTDQCGVSGTTPQLPGPNSGTAPVNGRCGPGPRTPLLVISPWAQPNYIDHTQLNQASILRFIEDNWSLGRIGGGAADAGSNSLTNMFNFTQSTPQNANMPVLSTITGLP